MHFWNTVFDFFWRDETLAALLMVLSLAVLLFHFRREERRSVFNTLVLFFLSLLGQFVSGLFHVLEFSRVAGILLEVSVIGSGIAVIRLWGLLLFRIVLPLFKLSPPRITEDIIVIIAYIGWGMVRLRYAGLELGSIVATSAMMTAVMAFAMQDTLGNILGGLALQLDNSISVGDWIKVDDIVGKVVDIRWRSTLVETNNWETVVFPNSQLMKNKFMVLGRRTNMPVQWRRHVFFNVGLDTFSPKVIAVVEESVRQAEISHVAKKPMPSCVLVDMDNKGFARYDLSYWLNDPGKATSTDAVMRWHLITALQRADIKLAKEDNNIQITRKNEKDEEAPHPREILLRMKTLRHVELFSQMTDEELRRLAESLKYSCFPKGNIITKQGATAHWLYIIISGEAEAYLETQGGGKFALRTMSKGNFFGEMGLMTGAPRTASVAARTDVECYRLDKEIFEEILRARPGIAEEMSHILAMRKAASDSALQDIDAQNGQNEIAQQRSEILVTIKRFFGLGS